ncbi:nucleotidyl transferase AbiEii/AbiGii toxin family protein [Variovorax sp. LjRoot84]|uniref:nucleotidyl transferase AbiEii/AbiGii toxin family protein n=1 Tax=unclassified Variovorax TaxID=663243 RepID=UPI0008906FA3|nr:nucleotidyl transferase AbiEii/AbiGii toxin family protein [Variovorax sp. CF079]SDE57788.1 Nucleotidyl transferase AbiEii toxin, Type IV TA system [Variovorax sp. CF079]
MSAPDFTRPGVWQELLAQALQLTDHLADVVRNPTWSFGGGTVLMLRLNHRFSKDIDLFVPDPQYLGHFSPRLTDVAEALTTEYEEAAEYTKLFLPAGEIDIVVGTSLTDNAWDAVQYQGRTIRVESCAEIVAKKMHHRGNLAKARDLFDLCAVADMEPEAIEVARPFFVKHGKAFLQRLRDYKDLANDEFDKIDRLAYDRSFDYCLGRAEGLLASPGSGRP